MNFVLWIVGGVASGLALVGVVELIQSPGRKHLDSYRESLE